MALPHLEDIVVFLAWKVFIFVNFSIASYKQKMCKSLFRRETASENKLLQKQKHMEHIWSNKPYKDTAANQELPFLHE